MNVRRSSNAVASANIAEMSVLPTLTQMVSASPCQNTAAYCSENIMLW